MKRKLSYRKSKKGIAEQYGISINKEMITNLGITKVIKNSKDNEAN